MSIGFICCVFVKKVKEFYCLLIIIFITIVFTSFVSMTLWVVCYFHCVSLSVFIEKVEILRKKKENTKKAK